MLNKAFQCLFLGLVSLLLLPSAYAGSNDNFSGQLEDPVVIVLFMFFGLCLGIVIMQISSIYGEILPYTVVMFFLGMLFSVSSKSTIGGDDSLGQSISAWFNIDGEMLLFIFLPPLIFGEAMGLNWFLVKGGLWQAFLLAGPGVIIGAVLMGAVAKYLLNWSWTFAMCFGSILSATDPVAVVALLKSTPGVSAKLTILIVGESLMNDGTAMVLFMLFYNMIQGEVYTAGKIIQFFFAAAVGSPLFGIACGLLMVRWLRLANRPLQEIDVTIQIAITICCSYLIFFVAQYTFEISGVLACCGAGCMISWLAPPIILNHETMHNVWGIVEWIGNSLIFLLAGLIIGHQCISTVSAMDWGIMVLLYLFLMVIRVIVIAVLYPWVSTSGFKCTIPEAAFMSWAGLRGALGMTLALLVQTNNSVQYDFVLREKFFFYIGGIAAMTLVFNATLAKSILSWLRLVEDNQIEKYLIMNQIRKRIQGKMTKLLENLQQEGELEEEEIDEVRQSISILKMEDFGSGFDVERQSLVVGKNLHGSGSLLGQHSPIKHHSTNPLHQIAESSEETHGGGGGGCGGGGSRSASRTKSKELPTNVNEIFSAAARSRPKKLLEVDDEGNPNRDSSDMSIDSKGDKRSKSSGGEGFIERMRALSMGAPSQQSLHDLADVAAYFDADARGPDAVIIPDLLVYVRAVFLEIVRVKYWQMIEEGKLPRLSYSASFLLYSIDVGLDEVRTREGIQDWPCIENEITNRSFWLKCLHYLEELFPTESLVQLTGRREALREKRNVYMLTSYIEAHEHAQKKIHAFLGSDDISETPTPEEERVKLESQAAVKYAKERLASFDPDSVKKIKSKQHARILLSKEAELVKEMMKEGLLSQEHAEGFLNEIADDAQVIEKSRNKLYRDQAKRRGQKRIVEKANVYKGTDTDSEGRSSLSIFHKPQKTNNADLMKSILD